MSERSKQVCTCPTIRINVVSKAQIDEETARRMAKDHCAMVELYEDDRAESTLFVCFGPHRVDCVCHPVNKSLYQPQ